MEKTLADLFKDTVSSNLMVLQLSQIWRNRLTGRSPWSPAHMQCINCQIKVKLTCQNWLNAIKGLFPQTHTTMHARILYTHTHLRKWITYLLVEHSSLVQEKRNRQKNVHVLRNFHKAWGSTWNFHNERKWLTACGCLPSQFKSSKTKTFLPTVLLLICATIVKGPYFRDKATPRRKQ